MCNPPHYKRRAVRLRKRCKTRAKKNELQRGSLARVSQHRSKKEAEQSRYSPASRSGQFAQANGCVGKSTQPLDEASLAAYATTVVARHAAAQGAMCVRRRDDRREISNAVARARVLPLQHVSRDARRGVRARSRLPNGRRRRDRRDGVVPLVAAFRAQTVCDVRRARWRRAPQARRRVRADRALRGAGRAAAGTSRADDALVLRAAHRRRRLRRRRAAEIRGLSAERLSLLLDGCLL